tara:strand:+ start:1413 stop:2432 length:1020 start_codon:yes stop_codon:yes gene_type:complete
MARLRMNDEYRKKIINRYISHAESEDTLEKQAYDTCKEEVAENYQKAFTLAKEVVERSYRPDDVELCQMLKDRYGSAVDVVAKDKCFYFSMAQGMDTEENSSYGNDRELSEHVDFGLFGSTDSRNYGDSGEKFAFAYCRDVLKEKGLNPDIYPQQKDNQDNPHKSQHIDACRQELGYSNYHSHNSDRDNNVGLTNEFDSQFYLDIIGTSHCRHRTIACEQHEFSVFQMFKKKKAQLVSSHETWISTIEEQRKAMMTGLKAYRFLDEGVELMNELGVQCDESDLITVNSTGLSMYNPTNLADMVKGMKNKTMTREQKIAERQAYDNEIALVVAEGNSQMH